MKQTPKETHGRPASWLAMGNNLTPEQEQRFYEITRDRDIEQHMALQGFYEDEEELEQANCRT